MANLETEIRTALDAVAHEVDVPPDLSERTLKSLRELRREYWRESWRARRDVTRQRGGSWAEFVPPGQGGIHSATDIKTITGGEQ